VPPLAAWRIGTEVRNRRRAVEPARPNADDRTPFIVILRSTSG